MSSPPKSAKVTPAIATILLMLGMYVGGYFALVEAQLPLAMNGRGAWPRVAAYRVGGSFAEVMFAPLNWMDRKIRYDAWHVTSEELQEELSY